MPKSFESTVNGKEAEVLRDLKILNPWEMEEKYGYRYYPTINAWRQKRQEDGDNIPVENVEELRTAWIRTFLDILREKDDELARFKATLEDLKKRSVYLEQLIRCRETIEHRELLDTLPLLKL